MRLLTLVLLLAGCAGTAPVSKLNPHTGVASHASAIHRLEVGPKAALDARAAVLMRDGAAMWVIVTSVTRRDGNFPKLSGAWRSGRKLDYTKRDRRYVGCDTGRCRREEVGHIRLSRGMFEAAAAGPGLTFQLTGARGQYTGHLPAQAFAEVLGRAYGGGM